MLNDALAFLQKNKAGRAEIAVVGDAMIDEYYYVKADRVSPEFPIPVMQSDTAKADHALPGGAANVAHQFKHYNVEAKLISMLDEDARVLIGSHGINVQHSLLPKDDRVQRVPRKKRVYSGNFPLCRWDIESKNYSMSDTDLHEFQQRLLAELESATFDVVIFSDYNKGIFHSDMNWIECVPENVVSIVDPKNGNLYRWRGCTIFKPNSKEAADLTGESDWHDQAKSLKRQLDCQSVVITQGGHGVAGIIGDQMFEYRPSHDIVARSVIGAGDCFVAFLAMTQARGIDLYDGLRLAFEAGAVYVQRVHNKPVSGNELIEHFDPIEAKLHSDSLDRTKKVVFTNGCFDILHAGHLKTLRYAKSLGDRLIVGVNSDESVKRLKGDKRPYIPLEQRMKMLAALECVDNVIWFDEDTPYKLIESLKPDVLVKGSDYQKTEIVGSDLVSEVVTVELEPGLSTTGIADRICQ